MASVIGSAPGGGAGVVEVQVVQALEWCLDLGIPCVSVYAFSLENFRRAEGEVAALMQLARLKLLAILQAPPAAATPSAPHLTSPEYPSASLSLAQVCVAAGCL